MHTRTHIMHLREHIPTQTRMHSRVRLHTQPPTNTHALTRAITQTTTHKQAQMRRKHMLCTCTHTQPLQRCMSMHTHTRTRCMRAWAIAGRGACSPNTRFCSPATRARSLPRARASLSRTLLAATPSPGPVPICRPATTRRRRAAHRARSTGPALMPRNRARLAPSYPLPSTRWPSAGESA
jgi:hypothetical protein